MTAGETAHAQLMIVSHKHKFIFLKTNKTAGTSIEIALSRFCGAEDIISRISPVDEETRTKLGSRGPQNHLAPPGDYSIQDALTAAVRRKRKARFYNHIPAAEIIPRIGRDVWESYYKFCFERNPWDRIVSLYYWMNSSDPRPTISEFVRSDAPLDLKRGGRDVYTIDGEIVVDRVCRFEDIPGELASIRKRFGLREEFDLPRAKSSSRTDKRHYREILGEDDRAIIAELFCDEIDSFGYEW